VVSRPDDATKEVNEMDNEIMSMNLADLDVADLEQRLELAVAAPAGCGAKESACGVDW
jgi:hypothetical protein